MFISFLHQLKGAGVPVSIRGYLDFIAGLNAGITNLDTNSFYHFARATLVKDERYFDRFDKIFSEFFSSLEIDWFKSTFSPGETFSGSGALSLTAGPLSEAFDPDLLLIVKILFKCANSITFITSLLTWVNANFFPYTDLAICIPSTKSAIPDESI